MSGQRPRAPRSDRQAPSEPVSPAEDPLGVLAITPYYAPEGGGLERYAHETLQRLAAQGYAVQAVTFTRQRPGNEERDGVAVDRRSPRWTLGNTPIDPGFLGDVRAAIKQSRPDVVLAHTPVPFPAEMAYLATRPTGIPFVTTYHAGRLRGSSPFLDAAAALDRATLQRAMLAGSKRLIAVSDFVQDNALAGMDDRTTVIPPGVDSTTFHPGQGGDDRTILFVGPISKAYRWKGLDVLRDAFELVKQDLPDARLELVGTGDRLEAFQQWGRRTGGVVLHGRLDEVELAEAYRRAAVLVLPSTTDAESFGMVMAEANASGTPVIASRVGGIPCFVRDGHNGLLVDPGQPTLLAEKIHQVLADPGLAHQLGRRGRRLVQRHHGWDEIAQRTEAVLQDAVASI